MSNIRSRAARSGPPRTAIYARFSTRHQDSIDVQLEKMRAYCTAKDLPIVGEYHDSGKTGTHTANRDGYAAMLQAIYAGGVDCVLLYDISRGSRDLVDWFSFRREMQRLGVEVRSLHDNLGSLDDPAYFIPEVITVGMNQSQVLTARMKSMDKIDMLAAQGKFCGGYAPLGYKIVESSYQIVPDEAEIVRRIFEMYAAGKSYVQILAALPPDLKGRRGKPLGKNSLYSILRNDRYVGTYSWCRREIKYFTEWAGGGPSQRAVQLDGLIPPIISQDLWERCQKRMEENTKNKTNHGKREYMLTGLLHCGACGAAFGGVTIISKNGRESKFYACLNKRRTHTCSAKNIYAHEIEPLVAALLRRAMTDPDAIERTADRILAAGRAAQNTNRDDLKAQIADLQSKINNLVKALSTGLDSDAVRQQLVTYETDKRALELKLKTAQPSSEELRRETLIKIITADAARLQNDPSALKELAKKYIVRIDVYDDELKICSTLDLDPASSLKVVSKTGKTATQEGDGLTTSGCGSEI